MKYRCISPFWIAVKDGNSQHAEHIESGKTYVLEEDETMFINDLGTSVYFLNDGEWVMAITWKMLKEHFVEC